MMMTLTLFLSVLTLMATLEDIETPQSTEEQDVRWIMLPGQETIEPGKGRRIVFMAGDEEYRSEEALPMLARMMNRHGFECIILFSQDPETGLVDPDEQNHIPGTHLIDKADLLVLFLRFRELSDEAMRPVVAHVESGKPVTGIRTSTHAFLYEDNEESPFASWSWNSDDPPGGFGGEILGETWVSHHGHHGSQATRGVVEASNADHPVLRGVDDVFGPTDVYGIRGLPSDSTILLRGAVIDGMDPKDPPVQGKQNEPMIPIAWVRERLMNSNSSQRLFVTTMGTAEDWSNEGLRTLFANSVLWQLGDTGQIPDSGLEAPIVGPWEPTPFGFGAHRPGYRPSDYKKGSPWAEIGNTSKDSSETPQDSLEIDKP